MAKPSSTDKLNMSSFIQSPVVCEHLTHSPTCIASATSVGSARTKSIAQLEGASDMPRGFDIEPCTTAVLSQRLFVDLRRHANVYRTLNDLAEPFYLWHATKH